MKIISAGVREENVVSSHKFRDVIPECVRFDRRGRFTTGDGSVSRGSTLKVEEDTKDLETCDY